MSLTNSRSPDTVGGVQVALVATSYRPLGDEQCLEGHGVQIIAGPSLRVDEGTHLALVTLWRGWDSTRMPSCEVNVSHLVGKSDKLSPSHLGPARESSVYGRSRACLSPLVVDCDTLESAA